MLLTNRRIRHDDHDVSVGGEDVDKGRKVGVPHFHALERGCKFAGMKKGIEKLKNGFLKKYIEIVLRGETSIFYRRNLPTTEFELFDYVTDLLKSVSVALLFALIVGDDLHSQSTINKQTLTSPF